MKQKRRDQLSRNKLGSQSERFVMKTFSDLGWWVHFFASGRGGQPCDLILLRGNESALVDVKHCEDMALPMERVEPNQKAVFSYATSLGIRCYFACVYGGDIYMIPFQDVNLFAPSYKFGKAELLQGDLK